MEELVKHIRELTEMFKDSHKLRTEDNKEMCEMMQQVNEHIDSTHNTNQ